MEVTRKRQALSMTNTSEEVDVEAIGRLLEWSKIHEIANGQNEFQHFDQFLTVDHFLRCLLECVDFLLMGDWSQSRAASNKPANMTMIIDLILEAELEQQQFQALFDARDRKQLTSKSADRSVSWQSPTNRHQTAHMDVQLFGFAQLFDVTFVLE